MNSTDLFKTLYKNVKFKNTDEKWWPNFGTFEVVVGAVLTQNTKWDGVQKALLNLKNALVLSLDAIVSVDNLTLALLIKPSGFYNIKAKRLKNLCKAIKKEFCDFENFSVQVGRDWLLSQKGIGSETCDAILCYACKRDEMVVDSYTLRVLNYLGYEFESYDECKGWLSGLEFDKIYEITDLRDENSIFCMYHGLIVEFCKAHLKGKIFDNEAKYILDNIKN